MERGEKVIEEFERALRRLDRSESTIRSYRIAAAHLLRWLEGQDLTLDRVTRQTIGSYVEHFRLSAKEGAVRAHPGRAGRANELTRKPYPALERQATTVNHRLSALSTFFAFLIERDTDRGEGRWKGRENPVPKGGFRGRRVLAGGRDAPERGGRGAFRMGVPRQLARSINAELAERLIREAPSSRDRALLALLLASGQRIGDWQRDEGRHGLLGMRTCDADQRSGTITVLLKGSRDEHRVPVTARLWPLLHRYLRDERPDGAPTEPLWVGFRRGAGRPLRYPAFAAMLRKLSERLGANVNAHMFRHSLAQALVSSSGLAVANRMLAHRNLSTTNDSYSDVPDEQLVESLRRAEWLLRPATSERGREGQPQVAPRHAFAYDPQTIATLEEEIGVPRRER